LLLLSLLCGIYIFLFPQKNSLPQFCDGLFLCLYEEYFERHCITIPRQNQYNTLTAFQFIAKKFITAGHDGAA